ncbi:MAG: PKD domain-containing protein, partial [Candidatus Bathyarchaeia archaeon]
FVTSGSTATGTWSFELEVIDAASAVVNSSSATVMVNAAPTVTISPGFAILNVGQSQLFTATPSGGSGLYDAYVWYVGGAAQSGQTASTFNFSLSSSGSYSVTVTVTDNLGATSVPSTAATVTASVTVTPTSASTLTPTPTPTPTASPSPTVPEFPYQLLGITLVVFMILVLSVFIIVKKRETKIVLNGLNKNLPPQLT